MKRRVAGLAALALGSAAALGVEPLRVSAAISLQPALQEAFERLAAADGPAPLLNAAASGVLLQQVRRGAPADVLLSASPREIEDLLAEDLALAPTRRAIASNRLIVVVPCAAGAAPRGLDDLRAGRFDRIALGNPATAPLGRYARQALESAGLWDELASRVVFGENARQVLDYVARGEAPAGVVYRTDARRAPERACTAFEVAPALHEPVTYEGIVLRQSLQPARAGALVDWLASAAGAEILFRHGFLPPE